MIYSLATRFVMTLALATRSATFARKRKHLHITVSGVCDNFSESSFCDFGPVDAFYDDFGLGDAFCDDFDPDDAFCEDFDPGDVFSEACGLEDAFCEDFSIENAHGFSKPENGHIYT